MIQVYQKVTELRAQHLKTIVKDASLENGMISIPEPELQGAFEAFIYQVTENALVDYFTLFSQEEEKTKAKKLKRKEDLQKK